MTGRNSSICIITNTTELNSSIKRDSQNGIDHYYLQKKDLKMSQIENKRMESMCPTTSVPHDTVKKMDKHLHWKISATRIPCK